MKHNKSVMDSKIRLAMKYQSDIEGKRVTKDEVLVLALHEFMKRQEKILSKGCANIGK
ncbi:hypothetical protein [Sporosarcina sp. G11-34]|uniref:hypothetical protein n=1 Tax=Sporosarcina sp. G11-34 TaxID=2849605 RepID=UPI0022A941D0|nr:hypothetical protein [Sporosarcina sp. G11-34]MCZ2259965.1 hypothetical protein [Sporosarcina sp. G11-34]